MLCRQEAHARHLHRLARLPVPLLQEEVRVWAALVGQDQKEPRVHVLLVEWMYGCGQHESNGFLISRNESETRNRDWVLVFRLTW